MNFNFGLPQSSSPLSSGAAPFSANPWNASAAGPTTQSFGFGFQAPPQQPFTVNYFQLTTGETHGKSLPSSEVKTKSFAGLSTKELASILSKGSQAIWMDREGGTCMAPWESLLLSLLLGRGINASSRDVALTLTVARSIFLGSSELRRQKPVVQFEAKSFRRWMYEPSYGYDWAPLCEVLGQPSPSQGLHCSMIGILPPKNEFPRFAQDILRGAAMGDQFDVFRLVVEHRKGSPRHNPSTSNFLDLSGNSEASLLSALIQTSSPVKYLSIVSIDEILEGVSLSLALNKAALCPTIFDLVCQHAVKQEGSLSTYLEFFLGSNCASADTLEIVLKYYDAGSDPCPFDFFFRVFRTSVKIATKLIENHFHGITNVVRVSQHQAQLLLACSTDGALHVRKALERDNVAESKRQLETLSFVLERCPAIGFDVGHAIRTIINGPIRPEYSLEALKYLFSAHLGLTRTKELLMPKDLLKFFRTREAMQYAFEELGYPVPDPTSVEKERMLMDALTTRDSVVVAPYLLRLLQPQLSPAVVLKCLELSCAYTLSASPEPVVEIMEYFIERGWLTKGFRFANGNGLQHRVRLSWSSEGRLAVRNGNSDDLISIGLVNLLRKSLQLDFTELSPAGEFPLALALQRGAWPDVLYLLREGLIPSKEVLLKYRYDNRGDIHTLLTLFFTKSEELCSAEANWPPDVINYAPSEKIFGVFKNILIAFGKELVRELAQVPIQSCIRALGLPPCCVVESPFALAQRILPVMYVEHLVDELHIDGSSASAERENVAPLGLITVNDGELLNGGPPANPLNIPLTTASDVHAAPGTAAISAFKFSGSTPDPSPPESAAPTTSGGYKAANLEASTSAHFQAPASRIPPMGKYSLKLKDDALLKLEWANSGQTCTLTEHVANNAVEDACRGSFTQQGKELVGTFTANSGFRKNVNPPLEWSVCGFSEEFTLGSSDDWRSVNLRHATGKSYTLKKQSQ